MIKKNQLNVLGLFLLASCTSVAPVRVSSNESISKPTGNRTTAALTQTIHVISTTDLHGYIEAQANAKNILVGGVDWMAGYYKIAKDQDPETILLDSGDLFQGTLVSNDTEGASVVRFYNYVGYDATAIGNHDFDFGPVGPDTTVRKPGEDPLGALKARISTSNFKYLSANICSITEDEKKCTNANSFKVASFSQPYAIKTINGVKVGIIGLTTLDTPDTTMPQNVSNLRFMPLSNTLEKYVSVVKKLGAKAILVIAHSGGFCSKDSNTKADVCNPKDEIFSMIDQLSIPTRSSISVILAGHTHTWVNTVYNGIHVMINGRYGQSFGYLTLNYDAVSDLTSVESAESIDFCQSVFSDSNKCAYGTAAQVAPTFLGTEVKPDPKASQLIAKDVAAANRLMATVEGTALTALTKDGLESTMGDLMADSQRECYLDSSCTQFADVAIQNAGGIRSQIAAGAVTYGDIFQVLPFDNYVATAEMTGQQLYDLLDVLYAYGGFPQVSGLQITFDSSSTVTRSITNTAGETGSYADPIKSVLVNGQALDVAKTYKVVMADFMATGGSGTAFILTSLKPAPVINYNRKSRDSLVDYFRAHPQGVGYQGAAPRLIDKKIQQ